NGAAVYRRQLGRPGPASARQFRRLHARRVKAEMARGPWHRALDAFLHGLWPRAAASLLRLFSARQGHDMDEAAARVSAGPPPWRKIRAARRKRVAAQAYQVDQVLSQSC